MLRQSSYDNPLGLRLGERVNIKRYCSVEYDVDGKKDIKYSHLLNLSVVVTGSIKKALGQYEPADRLFLYASKQPRLRVSNYIRLYEVKEKLNSRAMLAHPDDIELIS